MQLVAWGGAVVSNFTAPPQIVRFRPFEIKYDPAGVFKRTKLSVGVRFYPPDPKSEPNLRYTWGWTNTKRTLSLVAVSPRS